MRHHKLLSPYNINAMAKLLPPCGIILDINTIISSQDIGNVYIFNPSDSEINPNIV
jgi:hypothetical protein